MKIENPLSMKAKPRMKVVLKNDINNTKTFPYISTRLAIIMVLAHGTIRLVPTQIEDTPILLSTVAPFARVHTRPIHSTPPAGGVRYASSTRDVSAAIRR